MRYIIESPLRVNQIIWRVVKKSYDRIYKPEKCKIDAIVYDNEGVNYLIDVDSYENFYDATCLYTDYKTAREVCKKKKTNI